MAKKPCDASMASYCSAQPNGVGGGLVEEVWELVERTSSWRTAAPDKKSFGPNSTRVVSLARDAALAHELKSLLHTLSPGSKAKLPDEFQGGQHERSRVAAVRAVEDVQEGVQSESRVSAMALEEAEDSRELSERAQKEKRMPDRPLKEVGSFDLPVSDDMPSWPPDEESQSLGYC
ncbi:uncharacterized protein PHACADRAFT_203674 [Phanerochaete carnosa HHB-10118-sp]|uniref:Uncharacterized protein n=1 Tax=Phanerochaete carnosa (strain HHB-10118-sp) TaxID=650164 RepID=K5WMQ3_PHACS|nr:uncharacterized protein PHACADRAFT_203674 [Phanerochaete carnosa HHB-10118-sp]EKM60479.1 hypothetical protein PHACADRAFT_203674 [Phanerochaete carnosa HHB-10118-sp]